MIMVDSIHMHIISLNFIRSYVQLKYIVPILPTCNDSNYKIILLHLDNMVLVREYCDRLEIMSLNIFLKKSCTVLHLPDMTWCHKSATMKKL